MRQSRETNEGLTTTIVKTSYKTDTQYRMYSCIHTQLALTSRVDTAPSHWTVHTAACTGVVVVVGRGWGLGCYSNKKFTSTAREQ